MTNKKLLDERAGSADFALPGLPVSALKRVAAAALITAGALSPSLVHALALGPAKVLSSLGEPMRVEIDVPQISAEEAGSLKVGVPPPATFQAAGVEYNPSLARAAITLERRADGRAYLRVTSDRPVSEPFVDLILEVQWASGRVVRDYTLLFDPPVTRPAAPAAPVAAQVPAAPAPAPVRPPASPSAMPLSALPPSPQAAARRPAPPPPPPVAATRAPVASPPPVSAPAAGTQQVQVKAGETAGKIAAAHLSGEVSLDQMLVAMLRANPDAFIGDNVNRIKAGALIELPTAQQAASVSAAEARKLVAVQAANFNEFRRKLAESATTTVGGSANRQAGGKLQTSVEDRQAAAASPDKLKLSKGGVKGQSPEAAIASQRQKQEADQRVAELSRNIKDLDQLQKSAPAGATGAAPAAGTASASGLPVSVGSAPARPASAASASAPATSVVATAKPASAAASAPAATASLPASAAVVAPAASATAGSASASASAAAPAVALAASGAASTAVIGASGAVAAASAAPAAATAAPVAASAAAAPASKPASVAKPKMPPPPPPPEPSFLDELLDNPLIPAGLVGLLALLGGFGYYRMRQRKQSAQVDSSFLESKAQPDSFFGSSGGQHVDTNDETPTGSSLAYSPSQLDAAGDVDPVAEADVYLAYGRDLQAEEILREALRVNPTRIAIHSKLLEIYAKRRDVRAFEVVAEQALKLTGGDGTDWERICGMGRDLDSDNALYQPGGRPVANMGDSSTEKTMVMVPGLATATQPVTPVAQQPAPAPQDGVDVPIDLDLGDLDLPLDDTPAPSAAVAAPTATPPVDDGLSWEALDSAPAPLAPSPSPAPAASATPPEPTLDFDVPDLDLSSATEPASLSSAAPAPEPADASMIEFDLGSLSLDLDQSLPATHTAASAAGGEGDPMETKLALAQEFHAIGDAEGARTLVEEVIAGSTGALKAKAQRFLSELS